MNKKHSPKRNLLLVALLLVILFLSLFSFKKSCEIKELKGVFDQEALDLQNSLDEMIKDYTDVVVRKKDPFKTITYRNSKNERFT